MKKPAGRPQVEAYQELLRSISRQSRHTGWVPVRRMNKKQVNSRNEMEWNEKVEKYNRQKVREGDALSDE